MEQTFKVKKTFETHAKRYERWFSKEAGKLIKKTETRAAQKLAPKGKGLEIGVGSGIFASALGVEYGVDPAEKLLQIARSKGVKTVLGIAEKLPFKKSSFDFLLLMFTLSFLTNPLEAFRESNRVLKRDGKFIVCFIPKESPWGKFYRKKKEKNHEFYKHAKFHKISEVEELLKKSGFRITKAVSTLFQKPGSIKKVEKPAEGTHKSAGLCCFKTIKN